MNRYSYEELAAKALKTREQNDIDALGEWFANYGTPFWNGEVYYIDGTHSIRPIYKPMEGYDDQYEISGYELC